MKRRFDLIDKFAFFADSDSNRTILVVFEDRNHALDTKIDQKWPFSTVPEYAWLGESP